MSHPFPFNPKAFGFSVENAYALAQAAALAYDVCNPSSGPVRDKLTGWGFDPGRLRCFDRLGTQAFLACDDEKIILAFRGTEPDRLEDWVADARIRKTAGPFGDVHRGFFWALTNIMADVEDALEEFRDPKRPQTLWVTGHSLGAALATLATASLKFREQPVVVNGLYTFGKPRAGSEKFAEKFNSVLKSRTFRFVNNNDLVTRVPPSVMDYSHVGQMRYFDRNGALHADQSLSWWDRFWDRMGGRLDNYLDLNLFDGIADHSMGDYLKLTRRAYDARPIASGVQNGDGTDAD